MRNRIEGVKVNTIVDFTPNNFWVGSWQIEFSNDAGDKVTVQLNEDKMIELSRRAADRVKDIQKRRLEEAVELTDKANEEVCDE
jgi:hypothetical protein